MLKKYVLVGGISSALTALSMSPAFGMNISNQVAQLDAKKPLTATISSTTQSTQDTAAQSPVVLDRSGADRASIHLQVLQQTTTHFADCSQDNKKSPGNDASAGGGMLKPVSNSYKQF